MSGKMDCMKMAAMERRRVFGAGARHIPACAAGPAKLQCEPVLLRALLVFDHQSPSGDASRVGDVRFAHNRSRDPHVSRAKAPLIQEAVRGAEALPTLLLCAVRARRALSA